MKTTTQSVTFVSTDEKWPTDAGMKKIHGFLMDGWTVTLTKSGKCLTRVKTIVIPTID